MGWRRPKPFSIAFPTHFPSILHFTSLKKLLFYFTYQLLQNNRVPLSILHTNFYKTPYVSLFILQYLLLKYYKIFIFYNIFSRNPRHTRRNSFITSNPTPELLHHQQPKSIAHPMPKAGKPSSPNPETHGHLSPQPPQTHAGKPIPTNPRR